MKRKLRIFGHLAIICLSVCMFAFGVYAASTVSVTTSGTVTFTADNVDATIVRTVSGYDAAKSTVVIDDANAGTATVNINKTTTPEGALHKIEDKFINEKLVFDENATPIVMTFTITNNSTDRNLKYVLGGSATGTGIKTKLMTGERLILIDDDNYLDPYVEDDDAFVNTTTITITFTVADKNVSTELSYNYNIALSVVKPIVADNFAITSTNSTYGSATVLSKAGNTVKVNVALNENGQFSGFESAVNGIEVFEGICQELSWGLTSVNYIIRLVGNGTINSLTAKISQFDTTVYRLDYGKGNASYGKSLTCVNSNTFTLTNIDVPDFVCVDDGGVIMYPIDSISFDGCSSLKTVTLGILNSAAPHISGTNITEVILPKLIQYDNDSTCYYYLGSSGLNYMSEKTTTFIINDIGKLASDSEYDSHYIDNVICPFSDMLEVIRISPYNSYYDSRENCNAWIRSDNDCLILGCKNTVIPNSVKTLGACSFQKLPSTFTTLSIPKSITTIYNTAFCNGWSEGWSGLTTINYAGTKAEWNAISIIDSDGNPTTLEVSKLTSLKVECTDGEIVIK